MLRSASSSPFEHLTPKHLSPRARRHNRWLMGFPQGVLGALLILCAAFSTAGEQPPGSQREPEVVYWCLSGEDAKEELRRLPPVAAESCEGEIFGEGPASWGHTVARGELPELPAGPPPGAPGPTLRGSFSASALDRARERRSRRGGHGEGPASRRGRPRALSSDLRRHRTATRAGSVHLLPTDRGERARVDRSGPWHGVPLGAACPPVFKRHDVPRADAPAGHPRLQ